MKDIVITGFTGGSGKSYFTKRLVEFLGGTHEISISHTSRNPRGKECDGAEYHFVHPNTFRKMIDANQFLEWNQPREDIFYGTSLQEYYRIRDQGKGVIFDVDFVGLQQLKEKNLDLFVVALLPTSLQRGLWMNKRGDMNGAAIGERLNFSQKVERPFFRNKKNNHFFDLKVKKYRALHFDLLLNTVANAVRIPSTI